MRVNLRSKKFTKISSLVDFYSLYQLLHSQVYRNGLKLRISNMKICIHKRRRIKLKTAKKFVGKNLQMTHNALRAD